MSPENEQTEMRDEKPSSTRSASSPTGGRPLDILENTEQYHASLRARRKFDLIVVPLVTMFCGWNAHLIVQDLDKLTLLLLLDLDFLSFLVRFRWFSLLVNEN